MSQFDEYPKVIDAGGIKVTVKNKTEADRWMSAEGVTGTLAQEQPPEPTDAPSAEGPAHESFPTVKPKQDVFVDQSSDEDAPEDKKKPVTHKGGKKK